MAAMAKKIGPLPQAVVSSIRMAVELDSLLDELEARIAKLKIRYEQYLIGIEKFEPLKERKEVARQIRYLQSQVVSRTAHKFKLHALIQRFTTFKHYWNRCQRQIEEGTFKRDLARMQRELKRQGIGDVGLMKARTAGQVEAALARGAEQQAGTGKSGSAAGRSSAEKAGAVAAAGTGAAAGAAAGPPEPAASKAKGVKKSAGGKAAPPEGSQEGSKDGIKRIYSAFLEARRRTGESTDGLTFDKVARTIEQQVVKIRKSHGCKEVEFKVEVKSGRAVLKATPKK